MASDEVSLTEAEKEDIIKDIDFDSNVERINKTKDTKK